MSHQILAIDRDIEQTTTIIQKIEELISQAKIEKGVNNIYKEAYKNKEEDENSKKNDNETSNGNGKANAPNNNIVQGTPVKNGTSTKQQKFPQDGKVPDGPEQCKNCRIF